MAGTFSGGEIKDVVEAVHAVEDWSDDEHHIKPIRDNTLFYNDILLVKVKKDHKDGRSEEHSGMS